MRRLTLIGALILTAATLAAGAAPAFAGGYYDAGGAPAHPPSGPTCAQSGDCPTPQRWTGPRSSGSAATWASADPQLPYGPLPPAAEPQGPAAGPPGPPGGRTEFGDNSPILYIVDYNARVRR